MISNENKLPLITESQLAYQTLGEHLLATVDRNASQPLSDEIRTRIRATMDTLMLAFSHADEEGSVCVNVDELHLTNEELTHLETIGLLAQAPLKLEHTPPKNIPFIWDRHGDSQRLYLQRSFAEEREVALAIADFKTKDNHVISSQQEQLINDFKNVIYDNGKTADAKSLIEQEKAIRGALTHSFFIITGGPGTGKTTVVAKLIECLLADKPNLTIGLAAPTGKAASRVMQSIIGSCQGQSGALFKHLKAQLDENKVLSQTIHRWLSSETKQRARPGPDNALDPDIFIVDEASMIDLSLAKQLLHCIDRKKTRLILLGDKYQLAAVGPGSVLGDLTESKEMQDHVAELTISHRFTHDSNIGQLATYININQHFDLKIFKELANREAKDSTTWIETKTTALLKETEDWIRVHLNIYTSALRIYLNSVLKEPALMQDETSKAKALKEVWEAADSFRILAAQRHGFNSVEAVNRFADEVVRKEMTAWAKSAQKEGLLQLSSLQLPFTSRFYPGRIIINRQNYAPLDIFNGDVGITLPMNDDWSRYEVFFGDRKEFRPAGLLPDHDTAFALTIHQSQGSQFDHVAVLLSNDPSSSLSTRELLYTGVTRAKKEVIIFANAPSIQKACTTKTARASGLMQRLEEV